MNTEDKRTIDREVAMETAKMDLSSAYKGADAWFATAEDMLEAQLREVRRNREKLQQRRGEGDYNVNPEDLLSWTLMSMNNLPGQLRMDLAVSYASRIAAAKARIKGLREE